MNFNRTRVALLAHALIAGPMLMGDAAPAHAQVMVGGAPMYANKDIVDNAVNSKDHTTLVAAVKAAGLVDTLKGAGPVHGVRAGERGVRRAAGRHGGHAAEAREQG